MGAICFYFLSKRLTQVAPVGRVLAWLFPVLLASMPIRRVQSSLIIIVCGQHVLRLQLAQRALRILLLFFGLIGFNSWDG